MSKKLTSIDNIPKPVLTNIDSSQTKSLKPHIGITYLEKNRFGLKHLFFCSKKDSKYVRELSDFIEKVQSYESISDLVEKHKSHRACTKNRDKDSQRKVRQIQIDHDIETGEMIHLHVHTNGNGEFVLHGFTADNNIFEIVWFDCKHEVHS